MNSFYSDMELRSLGFKRIGKNVFISRKASIYGAENMVIGSNVRIDDFCILSGRIIIGNYVHISAYAAMFGGDQGIEMKDFTGLSSRSVIYAISDDYSGETLTTPMVPERFRGAYGGRVTLEKHVLVGTGSTILPGVLIGEGSAVGSMSLVNKSLDAWGIYAGIPCQYRKARKKDLLKLEEKFLREMNIADFQGCEIVEDAGSEN